MFLLGVRVDETTKAQAITIIASFLDGAGPHFITTPNPEIIMRAYRDSSYRDILNKADLALPDGAGLLLVSRFRGNPLLERVSGTDIVPELTRLASQKGLRVALVGGKDDATINRCAKILGTAVVFARYGVPANDWNNTAAHEKIVSALRSSAPEVVIVGFGAPKQEQWINTYRTQLPLVRVFMGVGGAFELLSGTVPRAPRWVRRLWLEWLWRLIHEPARLMRIITAIIIFPLTVFYVSIFKRKS